MSQVEKMFKRDRKGFVFMLLFLLVASFFASLAYPTQAQIEEQIGLLGHADLTGTISDAGIDTDGSGKFDYLKISVEVNVSVAGEYIVNVNGLVEADVWGAYINVFDTKREYLTLGIHMVDVYLYGPVIYQSGLNPTSVSSISLQSVRFEQFMPAEIETLDYIYDVPLSQEYHYTNFDAPFSDVEALFTVYPNGSVVLSGALNYTHMIPFNPGPEVYGTADITRNGDLTVVSADYTFVVLPEVASRIPVELPIDTTEVSYQEQYSDTQFSTDLSVNMTLPPWLVSEYPFNTTDLSLLEAYSEGTGSMEMSFTTIVPESIRSMFPFNVTDVTITGQYMDEQLTGSITFHVISGLPIFDLDMDFEGNKTYLSLTGEGLVIYGDYPAIEFSIDLETLESILMDYNSTLPGKEEHSLYDETYGILECTHLNTTLTPYDGTGAWVDFDVGIHGDFIELIAYIVAQSAPPDTSEQVHDIIYEALSTMVDSVESVDLQIVYVHDSGEAEIEITFVDDIIYLVSSLAEIAEDAMTLDAEMATILAPIISAISLNASLPYISEAQTQLTYSSTTGKLQLRATSSGEIAPEEYYYYPTYPLPEEMPPELSELFESLRELFEALQETRLCNVTSYNEIFTYRDSVGNLRIEYTLEGDVNAQVNFVKDFMVPYMNLPSSVELFLNQTLIDILGLQMSFNVGSTIATGELTGIMLSPPIDPVNATCFKLESFFSLASEMAPPELPGEGGSLKITIGGGSNITHAVTLFRPPTVPEPTETAPDLRRMVWYNQSLSNLKDMEFRIQTQAYDATILVTDQENNPIPNATVNLYYPNGTLYTSLLTDDYGYTETTYVDYRYMPSGVYNLTATYMDVSAATPLTIGYTGTYIISIAMKGPQIVETVTAPKLVDATETAATILNITGISKPVEIIVRNVTAPPEYVGPPPGTWKVLGNYVQIMANETEITVSATMRIYYTTEQLSAAGLDESTLEIRFWNVTTGEWEPVESYVNTEEHYVWAIIDHFSFFSIMGQPSAPIWTQLWFLAIVGVVIIAVLVVSAFYIRRRKTAIKGP